MDYRQTQKEYQRLQQEIQKKRRAKTREFVRRVSKRMERSPSPFRAAHPQPTEPAHDLPEFRTCPMMRPKTSRAAIPDGPPQSCSYEHMHNVIPKALSASRRIGIMCRTSG